MMITTWRILWIPASLARADAAAALSISNATSAPTNRLDNALSSLAPGRTSNLPVNGVSNKP
jgi:hypothetical protein